MRFSVVVPVYNAEKYLECCIQSVVKQNFQAYELILVNDGSTDASARICDEFQKNYPLHIRVIHKNNQGPLAARIDGLSIATGEFAIFMDADDFIEDNAFNIIDEYLRTEEEIDVLVYSFRYYRNQEKADRFHRISEDGYIWSGQDKKEIYEKLAFSMELNSLWTKAIRMSLLKKDPTNYAMYFGKNMAEDLLFSLYSMTHARKIMYANKVLYNYRINEEGLAHNFTLEKIAGKNTLHVYKNILDYFSIWGLNNEESKRKLAARWFNDVMYTMTKCYENANNKERKLLLEYRWENLLPLESLDMSNPYMNSSYKKIYNLLLAGKTRKIQMYFLNKSCYRKLKRWKRQIIK